MPKRDKSSKSSIVGDLARIGRKSSKLASKLDGRSQILFAVEKPSERRDQDNAKHMLVGIYDYDRSESVVAVIDMEREIVVDVRETQAQFQLSDEERREAERIAGEDSTVRARLAGRNMNALTRLYFPTGGASPKHRYAIVFIRPNESERWYAIVDLTEGSIVDVVSRRRLAGE